MEIAYVKQKIVDSYGIEVVDLEKIKNVYKIYDGKSKYCLKVIKYELSHFLFIVATINHLYNNDFEAVPKIIKTKYGEDYCALENMYAYLTEWIDARESNYDNPIDIQRAATTLAELHIKSRGFSLEEYMKPRIGWLKWIETFSTRKEEILDFKRRIEGKEKKTLFDMIYIEHMEEEIFKCEMAVEHLKESEYYSKMMKEIGYKGFCHHDFAHHNVILDSKGKVNIIDFDYAILDTHLHDLASLLIRRMKNGKWDIKNAEYILDSYNCIFPIEGDDIAVMASFMEFPQDYWQIGIQYYWEKQLKGEDFFIKRLNRIFDDDDEKQEFIDEFRLYRYKGAI